MHACVHYIQCEYVSQLSVSISKLLLCTFTEELYLRYTQIAKPVKYLSTDSKAASALIGCYSL